MSGPLPAGAPFSRHEVTPAGAGAHGAIDHDWAADGWAPFTVQVVATRDGAQVFTPSVVNRRGRITSAGAVAAGNHRVWFLHPGMNTADGELAVTMHPPSVWDTGDPGNRPQLGLVLRAQLVPGSPNVWRAFIVWYDIAFATSGMLANTWQVDGTNANFLQGSGSAFTLSLNGCRRRSVVRWATRLDAFDAASTASRPTRAPTTTSG